MHDVAIVGGGPVGMLLAVLLAQDGWDVVVLERRTEISPRPRAMGIHPPSVAVLAQAGVDVTAAGRRIRNGIARADGRVLGRMAFRDPGIYSLPQQDIERMLRARFAELRPGGLRLGTGVTGLHRVTALGSAAADASAPHERQRALGLTGTDVVARLVVGADGIDSTVRRAAGIGMHRAPGEAHYLMADLQDGVEPGAADTAVLSFEREGVVESFPMPGGRRRWVAVTGTLRRPPTVLDLARIVAQRTGDAIPSDGVASSFTARQRLAERMTAGRVVLVGDAAHEISPIGGQGLNLGWLDAAAIARLLRHPSPRAWARFDRTRRASARAAANQAAFNMTMGRAMPAPVHTLRSMAIRTLGSRPFRALLVDAFTMRRR
jgi:2-polyprenyl-6-methoxyphenol hydroxylase-like FAD-dependent oxidoreductase